MGTFGSSKVAKNTTLINDDHRTQDNKIAAQDSTVIATAGGNFTDAHGSISASRDITITQTDPNSFGFASHLIDQVFGANATTLANARTQATTATEALGHAAQVAQTALTPPAAGSHWKKWAVWGAVVVGVIGVGFAILKRSRRK